MHPRSVTIALPVTPIRAFLIAVTALFPAVLPDAQTLDDLSTVTNNPAARAPASLVPPAALPPLPSLDSLLVRPGFQASLFASEPEVQNPMAMAFDHLGRLWVAEALDYPHGLVSDPFGGGDRIKILEDSDGDGKADKVTIFASGLNLVSALALVPEGLVVGMAPNVVLFTDADGNDQADGKRILYSGFGRGDTHGVLSSFQYAMDGWVYGTVGLSGLELPPLGRLLNGMYRFRPDGTKLEWIGNFPNNAWGLGLNEAGQFFGGTANGQHVVHMAIPDRYYRAAGLPPRLLEYHSNSTSRGVIWSLDHFIMEPVTKSVVKVDFLTEFTASTNAEVYTARDFPKEYWNRATFACEPTGHLCHTDWQEPKGSGFVSKSGRNFLASRDPWTAPIAAKTGPKGELYVIDWYDPVIQHNCWASGQACGTGAAYTSSHRDKQFGRIWRIVWSSARPQPAPDLRAPALPALVAALKHANLLWRMNAQRLLVARKDIAAVPLLNALLADTSVDEAGINGGAAHALWTLAALGALTSGSPQALAATSLAKHPSFAVRMALLDALPRDEASARAVAKAGLQFDAHSHVRLKAMLALTEMPRLPEPITLVIAHRDLDRLSQEAAEMLGKAQTLRLVTEVPSAVPARPVASLPSVFSRPLHVTAGFVGMHPLKGLPPGRLAVFDGAGRRIADLHADGSGVPLRLAAGPGAYRYAYTAGGEVRAHGTLLSLGR